MAAHLFPANRASRISFRRIWFYFLLILSVASGDESAKNREDSKQFWMDDGLQRVKSTLAKQLNTRRAKNVILFLGDGMGMTAVTAGRIYRGQTDQLPSDQASMSFERFPFTGLSKTYSRDRHTTDSAASATAYLCGVKARQGTSGVGPEVHSRNCTEALQHPVKSVADWAIEEGKWAGVVTTARVTHATPAALYAHSAFREWETDFAIRRDAAAFNDSSILGCTDIARQLVRDSPGRLLRVILGGGRGAFMTDKQKDPEYDRNGFRNDDIDLLKEWKEREGKRKYAWNRTELNSLDVNDADYLLGLFEWGHMRYELDKKVKRNDYNDPTLAELTRKAIQMLSKNDNGYFLLVESARIDTSLHDNRAKRMVEEVKMFHETIETATNMTDPDDTLLIVTADHSHAMSIIGYPDRSVPIMGKFMQENQADGLPTTILVFANGRSAQLHNNTHGRRNLTNVDTEAPDFLQPAFMPTHVESHSGEDVAVYAKGPWAHLLSGTHENTAIAHVIGFAMCAGPAKKMCEEYYAANPAKSRQSTECKGSSVSTVLVISLILVTVLLLLSVGVIVLLFNKQQNFQAVGNIHELNEVNKF